MANTRDLIGDQATVDGLVNHTLTELEEDGVTKIYTSALAYNNELVTVNFPNVISSMGEAFANCSSLQNVTLPKLESLTGTYHFNTCQSLESISLPELKGTSQYMFNGCTFLSSVNLPKVTIIEGSTFSGCKSLVSIDTSNVITLQGSAFSSSGIGTLILPNVSFMGSSVASYSRIGIIDQYKKINLGNSRYSNAYSLCHLILRSSEMCTLVANALSYTGIAKGIGWIYVPTDLVETYKADSKWSTYANQIVDISEYPKALQDETISDSWNTIFANEENGTYKSKYSIGDVKYTSICGTPLPMQIVAFDEDVSKITWLCKCAFESFPMVRNSGDNPSWGSSYLRSWLRNNIYPNIDSDVRNHIVPVEKTYYNYNPTQSTITDTIWIPSAREMFGTVETSGIMYTDFFTDDASKCKALGLGGTTSNYWTRSMYDTTNKNWSVSNAGTTTNGYSYTNRNIVIGFCT